MTAYVRAYHAINATDPIFNDTLASRFFTPEMLAFFGGNMAALLGAYDPDTAATGPDEATALAAVMRLTAPTTLSRSRFAEDSLRAAIAGGLGQYVLLGAGLETFAFRETELLRFLRVFELDHPATQAFKRRRLVELGWADPEHLHYVPIDFATRSVAEALRQSSFDPSVSAFTSWLGVTYYLPRETVLGTLRSLAGASAAGSAVVFDYYDLDAFDPQRVAPRMRSTQAITQRAGEPAVTGFDPSSLAGELAALGWDLDLELSPADLQTRYFAGRTDGYTASEHVHVARAWRRRSG
ncbi:MAG: class I SAM-dependent methyltransferase [Dactylosporangium sp.]|nr:class I SAM-dependent methyltransferase [Dactylosporangium sp.]